ncbi:MAG: sulfotransferase domain-containing protein [Chloroflexota bacterium]
MTQEIIVVSGFKRSGTSLMMHIVQQLGIPLFFDTDYEQFLKEHLPDTSNAYYYEHPAIVGVFDVKPDDLRQLQGFAVKAFIFALMQWPDNLDIPIKIILMKRDLNDVIQSMQKYKEHPDWAQFLRNKERAGYRVSRENLEEEIQRLSEFSYEKARQKFEAREKNAIHEVEFSQLLYNPFTTVKGVAEFLSIDVKDDSIEKIIRNNIRNIESTTDTDIVLSSA